MNHGYLSTFYIDRRCRSGQVRSLRSLSKRSQSLMSILGQIQLQLRDRRNLVRFPFPGGTYIHDHLFSVFCLSATLSFALLVPRILMLILIIRPSSFRAESSRGESSLSWCNHVWCNAMRRSISFHFISDVVTVSVRASQGKAQRDCWLLSMAWRGVWEYQYHYPADKNLEC